MEFSFRGRGVSQSINQYKFQQAQVKTHIWSCDGDENYDGHAHDQHADDLHDGEH